MKVKLVGDPEKGGVGGYEEQTVSKWLNHVTRGIGGTRYGPTPSHLRSLNYAKEAFAPIRTRLNSILGEEIPAARKALLEADAPWGRGQMLPASQR